MVCPIETIEGTSNLYTLSQPLVFSSLYMLSSLHLILCYYYSTHCSTGSILALLHLFYLFLQPLVLLEFLPDVPVGLSTTTMSGLVSQQVPQGLNAAVLTTFCGMSHWDLGTSIPYSTQMFLYVIPATWLYHSVYAAPACVIHFAIVCCTISGASLHSLRALLRACSCAAMI